MTTKHIFIFFAVAACMCISCEDFLEIKPDKSIVVPDRLEDFQALLDNNAIMNAGTGHQLGEISGDNYFISRVAWENLTNAFQRNAYMWEKEIFEGELSTDWNNPSLVILYSNLALEGAAKITRDDRNFNEWNNLKGSALFFRAYAFYQLAQLFCDTYKSSSASQDLGIPLRLESDITLPSVRATIERTYRQIVADVTEASTLLPVVPVFKTRPSKPASHAFLARVFLQMGDYENALLHANLSLDDFNSLMDYNSIDVTDNFPFVPYNDEVIFHSHMSSPAILNQSRLQVADELLKAYEADDLRKTCFFRENNGSIVYRGSYYGSNAFFTGLSSNEVFMIAAECNARIGDVPQALECLNALLASRYRAGTLVAIEETDPQLLLDIILAERRKELPFRGLRWSDLKRLNLDSRYAKTLERIWENEAVVLEPNSPRYIFPIPDAVIDVSGIEQNER